MPTDDNDVLTVIPARGGSKRLPGKNIKDFAGKPLIQHTIEQAGKAFLDPIIVSTDDNLIAAKSVGAAVVMRPAGLAQDDTPTVPVLQHALEWAEVDPRVPRYGWVLCLQPTSPLRLVTDILEALMMRFDGCTSIASVKAVGVEGTFWGDAGGVSFHTNGAIYLVNRETLMKGRLWGHSPRLLVMPEDRSIDIDTREDFYLAERIAARRPHVQDR